MRASALALALLGAACDEGPPDLYFGLGSGRLQAVVTGRVVDAAASPIAAADVATRLYGDPACSSSNPGDLSPTTTNTDGRFTVVAEVPFSDPFGGCVLLRVTPPTGAALQPDSATAPIDLRLGPPYDTIFVEITLPASPAAASRQGSLP